MTPEHERLRQLILSWEELDDAERREADTHLAQCKACGELLAAFQSHERAPGPAGVLPESVFRDIPALETHEWRAAEASRLALREKLRVPTLAGPVRVLRPAWTQPMRWLIPAAAAAAALAIVWFARPRPALEPALGEVSAIHIGAVRGETPGGVPADTAWRTGDGFALHVDLPKPGWPVVVHVGPEGEVDLLRPEDGDTAPLPAGPQRLGPADPSREWVLEDPPGREDLLVAVSTRSASDRAALERELRTLAAAGSRDDKLAAVRRLLERRVGGVRAIVLQHR